ncbi:hypothetical protein N0V93_007096 [Gnomoniopsis smithogilvyi]|uniref:Uncharacterized protein n=1 Tax=Gnomoniopsis smithogilvyi TaxID=1191159 RepID=A0A9W8YT56_9PEZI|nr:hypothetical protein N0V93_007096 [Gnomoniopsis smithogilvyi]
MPGINTLPAGSEFAAAISIIWALLSWFCASLLFWLTWAHHEGWSYLALLAISAIVSNTFSLVQQVNDILNYDYIVTTQFVNIKKTPHDPELAIAGGSFGLDLVLYYIQYYSYSVQAMLVMFWAADFAAFVLTADLPLMLSLAIGSGLMIAVTVRYVQSRQKFTQWSPPKFNSGTSGSEAGTSYAGTTASSRPINGSGRTGLYDRWLMVRFTLAFIVLAVFEVTNTLFQITALQNNINDAKAMAPDLSAGRAIQNFFLRIPGTTPGIFLFIVFGTTRASRQKMVDLIPKKWQNSPILCCGRRHDTKPTGETGITIQRSLTVTSASRTRASRMYDQEDLSESSDVWMQDLTKRSDSAMSFQIANMKPLPLTPSGSGLRTTVTCSSNSSKRSPGVGTTTFTELSAIEEKRNSDGFALSRTTTSESLQVPDDYSRLGAEHSDDSGPILPIQRPEVRFAKNVVTVVDNVRQASGRARQSRNFSRPKA